MMVVLVVLAMTAFFMMQRSTLTDMGAVLAVLIVGVVVVSLSLQVVVLEAKFAQSISNCPMQTLAVLRVVVDVGFRHIIRNPDTLLIHLCLQSHGILLHVMIVPPQ